MTNSSAWAGAVRTVQYKVYLGTWVNFSRGRIMGATLTLDRVYGNLLIAFTATFVGIVTGSLWRIGCLVLHRTYSTSHPRDTLHHQRQAVLRNSPSPASALQTFYQLTWAWRRGSNALLVRTLPAMVFAAICLASFTIAGGFSSWISSAVGSEVLLDGSDCGNVEMPEFAGIALANYMSRLIDNAGNYAQECYSSSATGIFDCTTFVKGHLPGTVDDGAACPFQDAMCRSNDSNILFDSGYLDSRQDFGLNTPDAERLFFRTTLQCAPLATAGFAKNVSAALDNYTEYYYGPLQDAIFGMFAMLGNFTWQVEDLNSQYVRTMDTLNVWASDLQLSILTADTANFTLWDDMSDFHPDRRLLRPDADLRLIFLSGNGVYFIDPTYDAWYRGFVPASTGSYVNGDEEWTAYRPDEAASPMGCIQQYQYCNAAAPDRRCGQLAGFVDAKATAAPLFNLSLDQVWGAASPSGPVASRFTWFEQIVRTSPNLGALLRGAGAASLSSRRYFNTGYLSEVPDDQWKVDVTHWWATLLAAMQAAFVNAAHGPLDPSVVAFATPPENSYMEDMCRNQKILSTDYTSFSLFGLYFTFFTGILIFVISYSLEPLLAYMYRHRQWRRYAHLEWTANNVLQLQRLAYQGLGSEAWSGYTDAIPTTRPGYFLTDLPRSYAGEQAPKAGMDTPGGRSPVAGSLPRPSVDTGHTEAREAGAPSRAPSSSTLASDDVSSSRPSQ